MICTYLVCSVTSVRDSWRKKFLGSGGAPWTAATCGDHPLVGMISPHALQGRLLLSDIQKRCGRALKALLLELLMSPKLLRNSQAVKAH
jgi:hypothetical protein